MLEFLSMFTIIVFLLFAFFYTKNNIMRNLKEVDVSLEKYITDNIVYLGGSEKKEVGYFVYNTETQKYDEFIFNKEKNESRKVQSTIEYDPKKMYFNLYIQKMVELEKQPFINNENKTISYLDEYGLVSFHSTLNVETNKNGDVLIKNSFSNICKGKKENLPLTIKEYKIALNTKHTTYMYEDDINPFIYMDCSDPDHPRVEQCENGKVFSLGSCQEIIKARARVLVTKPEEIKRDIVKEQIKFHSDNVDEKVYKKMHNKIIYKTFKNKLIEHSSSIYGKYIYSPDGGLEKSILCNSNSKMLNIRDENKNFYIQYPIEHLDPESEKCVPFKLSQIKPIFIPQPDIPYLALQSSFYISLRDDGSSYWIQNSSQIDNDFKIIPLLNGEGYLQRKHNQSKMKFIAAGQFIVYKQTIYKSYINIPSFKPNLQPKLSYIVGSDHVLCAIGGNVLNLCVKAAVMNDKSDEITDDFIQNPSTKELFIEKFPNTNYEFYSTKKLYNITI